MNVKPGDLARIVKSIDGINVGKVVDVVSYSGEHSRLGVIWRVRIAKGQKPLVTEYGGVGITCDCADDWLRRIDPEPEVSGENTDNRIAA